MPEAHEALCPWPRRRIEVNGRRMAYIHERAALATLALLLHGSRH
ncbi:hypothetical protein [Sphingomonas sp. PAMC 26605]|nr:hypothetical protein [Sphingomonas sp. PAMC 26605]